MEKEKEPNNGKASLLQQWKSQKSKRPDALTIPKAPEGQRTLLSHGQQRLWFLQQLYPGNPFYNYSERYIFEGALDEEKLLEALEMVCQAHDILRSTYHMNEGALYIEVAPTAQIGISKHNLSHLPEENALIEAQKIMSSDARYSFDLSKQPVVLATYIKINETKHHLLLTLHHIATDKWSMGVLRLEWASYFKRLVANLTPQYDHPDIQYADFTYWQRNLEVATNQLVYWKEKLSGEIPFINLPTDFPRPAQLSFNGGSGPTRFYSKELSEDLLRLSREMEATPYVLFLSVFYLLLFRYSGQEDILIGSPVASRDHKVLEDLIGFFNDTVVLRTELTADMSFVELVKEVRQTTLEAFSNKDVPFDTLVKELNQERSLSINPFFQVMFLYHAVLETPSFGEGLKLQHGFFDAGVSKFDLTLYISEEEGQLSSTFEYSSDLFKASTIERFQDHLNVVLEAIVENPTQKIAQVSMLTDAEMELFTTAESKVANPFKEYKGIHDIITAISQKHPKSTAVTYLDGKITYEELNAKATNLAKIILEKTQGKNEIVGLCLDRSIDMIVGMLAILKAGCAYLPIDPTYPPQRIRFMLSDAEVKVLVTHSMLESQLTNMHCDLIFMNSQDRTATTQIALPEADENDMAYIIYTSGSTGNPKGVPITHKNIINSTGGRIPFYKKNPEVFLLLSSIAFDSSKAGIFWTLCTGGNLVIAENRIEQDISRIEDVIAKNKVSHTLMLPSLYKLILEHADSTKLTSLNTVVVAGEACPQFLCAAHFDKFDTVALYNEYGPTEATVWCIAHKVEKSQATGTIPLGKPVANATIYLLDDHMNKVPVGAIGEIYVGGSGLAGRYYKRPDLTEKAYVTNPFEASKTDKLYKTGDLGRYRSDGTIDFLGRSDQQVKIRGFRIEINEIENTFYDYEPIAKAVVVVEIFGDHDSKRLTAYITSTTKLDITEVKEYLKSRLPDYMVPTVITQVDVIPVLPNGKIDKISLQNNRDKQPSTSTSGITLPKNAIEEKLLELWKDVLQIEVIGTEDNFFDLGGDSIISIQFIAKAKKAGLLLSPNQIFDYQTIATLGAFLSARQTQTEEWDYLVALRKTGSKTPLFCIHAGGGHIFFYNVLTKYIDADRPIYAIQASGVYAEKNRHESIEQMAADYLKAMQKVQPEGPYNIMVYCFSVAVGHQLAAQFSALGQLANLIVMDTMADPWNLNTPKRLKMRLKAFAKRALKNPFKALATMISVRWIYVRSKISKVTATPDQQALIELNDNLSKICKVYDWHPVKGQVSIILTEKEEESINVEIVDSWKNLIEGEVNVVRTKGVHRNLFEEPDVKEVSTKIDEFSI